VSKSPYSEEFKSEAIKQIMENGLGVLEVSKASGVSDVTLYKWLKEAGWKSGDSKERRKLTETEDELKALKSELRKVKMERDILKKAAAYFAGESL
jgi:transposase